LSRELWKRGVNMSFSTQTKNELSRIIPDDVCCQKAELMAIIKTSGSIAIKGHNRLAIQISTENAQTARKIFTLFKRCYNIHAEILVRKRKKLKKNNSYLIYVTPAKGADNVLRDLNILHESKEEGLHIHYGIDKKVFGRDCCKRAYIRGSFLGAGSISDPGRNYHIEFFTQDETLSSDLSKMINTYGIRSKVMERKDSYVVYVKDAEQIILLLNLMGAHNALLKFENIRVYRGFRNRINRLVNCETANMGKTIEASLRQIEKINYIKQYMGLNKLSRPLREIAELRLNYPDASLKELGEKLVPPISKSGVNHRIRKIEKIAEDLEREHKQK